MSSGRWRFEDGGGVVVNWQLNFVLSQKNGLWENTVFSGHVATSFR